MSWFSLDLNKIPHLQIIAVVLVIFTSIFPPFFIISQYNTALFQQDLFKILIISAACGFPVVFVTVASYIALCAIFHKPFNFIGVVTTACFFIIGSYFLSHDYCYSKHYALPRFIDQMQIHFLGIAFAVMMMNGGEAIKRKYRQYKQIKQTAPQPETGSSQQKS